MNGRKWGGEGGGIEGKTQNEQKTKIEKRRVNKQRRARKQCCSYMIKHETRGCLGESEWIRVDCFCLINQQRGEIRVADRVRRRTKQEAKICLIDGRGFRYSERDGQGMHIVLLSLLIV